MHGVVDKYIISHCPLQHQQRQIICQGRCHLRLRCISVQDRDCSPEDIVVTLHQHYLRPSLSANQPAFFTNKFPSLQINSWPDSSLLLGYINTLGQMKLNIIRKLLVLAFRKMFLSFFLYFSDKYEEL